MSVHIIHFKGSISLKKMFCSFAINALHSIVKEIVCMQTGNKHFWNLLTLCRICEKILTSCVYHVNVTLLLHFNLELIGIILQIEKDGLFCSQCYAKWFILLRPVHNNAFHLLFINILNTGYI